MMTTMGNRAEEGQTQSHHTPTGVKQGATSSFLVVFTEFSISLESVTFFNNITGSVEILSGCLPAVK